MGYFQFMYDSRVVNCERKLFIRLATDVEIESSPFLPKVAEKVSITTLTLKLCFKIAKTVE